MVGNVVVVEHPVIAVFAVLEDAVPAARRATVGTAQGPRVGVAGGLAKSPTTNSFIRSKGRGPMNAKSCR